MPVADTAPDEANDVVTPLLPTPRGDAAAISAAERGLRLIRVESDAEPLRPRTPPARGASFWQGVINVVQVFMGLGLISMPYGMRLGGWAALAALGTALIMFTLSANLLIAALERLPPGVPKTYPALGDAAFGPGGRRLVATLALAEFGGGAICNLAYAFAQAALFFPAARLATLAPGVLAVTLPLLAVPTFRRLTPLSALGNVASVAVLVAVVACVVADPHRTAFTAHHAPTPPHHLASWSIVRSLGIFAVSVSGHSSLPALRASMADPSSFRRVVNTAFSFMATLYGGVAVAGYYYFGDKARQILTASLGKDGVFAGRDLFSIPNLTLDAAVGAFVLLNAVTTYPALVMIVQETLWATVASASLANPRRLRAAPRLALRLAVAAVSTVVAVGAYASITNALALLGGASSMSASLLLPIAAYARLASRDAVGLSRPRQIGLTALFCFGVCVTVAVVWQAAGDLIEEARRKEGGRLGGLVVNADGAFNADVLLRAGKVAAVGPNLAAPKGATVVDATNLVVAPGGVDPHTHLDAPFTPTLTTADDYYTGTRAALAGGTTTLLDFALPFPSVEAGFARHAASVERDAATDVALHMAINAWDAGVERSLTRLVKKQGVASFKVFLAYKNALAIDDDSFLRTLSLARRLGVVTMVHAENADAVEWARDAVFKRGVTGPEGHQLSRPAVLEDQGTSRALALAKLVGTPLYIVHVMSAGAARLIGAARRAGQPVFGESVISAIAADPAGPWRKNYTQAASFVMSPPIRSPAHQAGVAAALIDGSLQGLGTDHAPWMAAQKGTKEARRDFRAMPNGVNGIQERLLAAWDVLVAGKGAPPSRWVDVVSAGPARAFGLFPQKGALVPGADADVVLLNPALNTTFSAATHASRADVSIYEGQPFRGRVVGVWARGVRVVDEGGAITATRGAGRRLRLRAYGSSLWGEHAAWEAGRWGDEFAGGERAVRRGGWGGWGWGEL